MHSCYSAALDHCPYCSIESSRTWVENKHAIALADSSPIADGYTIIFRESMWARSTG
jgi:diadenosine tetraphosphate (Ap4A) HIT family hydrolase